MKNRFGELHARHFSWKEMPMARLVLALAPGIATGILCTWPLEQAALAGMGLFGMGCLAFTRKKIPFRYRYIYALFCLAFWFCAGLWWGHRSVSLNDPLYFDHIPARDPVWLVEVLDVKASGHPSAVLRVWGYWEGDARDTFFRARGKLIGYPEKGRHVTEGQRLVMRMTTEEIPAPKNPLAFDNKRYRFFQNIHHQVRIREGEYRIVGKKDLSFIEKWRNRQILLWKEHLDDPSVFAIAGAMVLGYKEELSGELRETYAQTGASHVLAVSGLHVGLIYLILSTLVGKWKWRVGRIAVSLAGIWGFALVTGATPSVVRAATMFSFVLAGQQMRRPISIFNSLGASAFLLLLIHPLWLFHLGFQLSYLAVLGIVVFQPRWYQLWIPPNGLFDKIWTLITVSLAAQMATLPLTLYYFHQFPVYFWLSGLIVVPAAPLIIGLGILLVLLSAVFSAWCWIPAAALKALIHLINAILELIQALPGSLITGIYLPGVGVILLLAALIFLAWIWEKRQMQYAWIFLLLLNGAAGSRCVAEVQRFLQPRWVVYAVYGHTLIDYMHRGYLWSLRDEELPADREEKVAGSYRKRHRVHQRKETVLSGEGIQNRRHMQADGRIAWGDRSGWIVHPGIPQEKIWKEDQWDFLLICGNPDIPSGLTDQEEGGRIVLSDASNRKWIRAKWQELCREKGWEFIDMGKTGYREFVLNRKPQAFSGWRSRPLKSRRDTH